MHNYTEGSFLGGEGLFGSEKSKLHPSPLGKSVPCPFPRRCKQAGKSQEIKQGNNLGCWGGSDTKVSLTFPHSHSSEKVTPSTVGGYV